MKLMLKTMSLLRDRYLLKRSVRFLEKELAKEIDRNLNVKQIANDQLAVIEKQAVTINALRDVVEDYKQKEIRRNKDGKVSNKSK